MIHKIKTILSDYADLPMEEMDLNTKLISDMGLNSLSVVDLICVFEEEFDIEIPDQDIKTLQSIGDIVSYIEKAIR